MPLQQPFLSRVAAGPRWVRAGGKFPDVVEGQGRASLAVFPRGQSCRASHRTFINYIFYTSAETFMINKGSGESLRNMYVDKYLKYI